MRFYFPFVCISVIFFSCHQHSPARLSRFDSIAFIDTTCRNDVNSATADFLKGKLTYCHFIGMLTPPFRNENELIKELRKYNIAYRNEFISDVITDQTQGCYCDYMREKINERYGNNFIDSQLNVSDSVYLANNINDTISYTNCDTWPRYPKDSDSGRTEQSSVFQEQCDSLIRYPVGYIKKTYPNESFVNVYFVVSKTGGATIVGYHFLFDTKSNNKYQAYFKRQIEKIVTKQAWAPAEIRRQKVTSEYTLRVYFE